MKFVRVVEHDPSYPEAQESQSLFLSRRLYLQKGASARTNSLKKDSIMTISGEFRCEMTTLFEMLVLEYMQAGPVGDHSVKTKDDCFDRFHLKISKYDNKKS